MVSVSRNVKFAIIIAVIIIAGAFAIAGAATPFSIFKNDIIEQFIHYNRVRTCINESGECTTESIDEAIPDQCGPFEDACNVALAFSSFAVIAMILVVIFSVLSMLCAKIPKLKKMVAVGLFGAAVFMAISWPVGFALHSSIECNQRKLIDTKGQKFGPSAPLLLVSFLFIVMDIVIYFAVKEEAQDEVRVPDHHGPEHLDHPGDIIGPSSSAQHHHDQDEEGNVPTFTPITTRAPLPIPNDVGHPRSPAGGGASTMV